VLVDPRLTVSEGHMISLQVEQRLKHEIAEIEDVTVHVDPEDDSTAPPCIDLPLRPAAMARLHAAWSHLDCLAKARRVGCTTCRDESTWTFTCPSAATGARPMRRRSGTPSRRRSPRPPSLAASPSTTASDPA